MSGTVNVQYVGFQSKALVREYSFLVREPASQPREFTLTILNEAFISRRARYQDGPGICSLKLHHELAVSENHPPSTEFCVSDEELADYQDARRPKPSGSTYRPSEH